MEKIIIKNYKEGEFSASLYLSFLAFRTPNNRIFPPAGKLSTRELNNFPAHGDRIIEALFQSNITEGNGTKA